MVESDKSVKADGSDDGTRMACDLDIRPIILEHYASVYRYAYRLAGSVADAEDLTQQTFLIAHEKLHQLRDAAKADRWLFAVVRSCFLKSRRRKRPAAAATMELDVDTIPDRIPTDEEIDREQLQAAMDDLPDDFKIVVAMFYFQDMSYKEMADVLEVPIGTVMSRLSRAKGRLRQRLLVGPRAFKPQIESPLAANTVAPVPNPGEHS